VLICASSCERCRDTKEGNCLSLEQFLKETALSLARFDPSFSVRYQGLAFCRVISPFSKSVPMSIESFVSSLSLCFLSMCAMV
jgi:hypothetical protein